METSRCKAFIAAAEEGSLTAAADRLGYTPSGVSQLVSALEDDLGVVLLDRARKGVALTDAGRRMIGLIRTFLASESNIYEAASDIKGLTVGSVTIAAYPSIAAYLLPDVIRAFQTQYPGIDIRITEGITQEIEEWLDRGEVDMAFMTDAGSPDYDWIPLRDDRMVAVLNPDHPLAGEESYPLSRCSDEDFIMPALGHDLDVEILLQSQGITPKIRFTTMENPVMLSMIRSGLGMSIMNELCTELWRDKLAIKPLDPPSKVTFGMVTQRGRHMSPAASRFMDMAVRMLTREQTL